MLASLMGIAAPNGATPNRSALYALVPRSFASRARSYGPCSGAGMRADQLTSTTPPGNSVTVAP